mgnify:CR=1 FL=1
MALQKVAHGALPDDRRTECGKENPAEGRQRQGRKPGQKAAATQIQTLLLDETPGIFGYFFDYLVPLKKNLKGVMPVANRLFFSQAYFA